MSRWLWIDGRFAWPPIIALATLTAYVVGVDLFWRLTALPFEATLAIAAITALVLVPLVWWRVRRHRDATSAPRPGMQRPPARDVAVLLGEGGGEHMAAGAVGDEVER